MKRNMRYRRLAATLLLAAMLLALGACGGGSAVQDSPSAAPATDTPAPTPDPTPTPCAHEWAAADYWRAGTCALCGETQGEPLVPLFVTEGYDAYMIEAGAEYAYTVPCYTDSSIPTTGTLTVESFSVFDEDESHAAKEGFRWYVAKGSMRFSDAAANSYGLMPSISYVDYYTGERVVDRPDFQVRYMGEDYACWQKVDETGEWAGSTMYISFTLEAQLPAGYDGGVLMFAKGMNEQDAEERGPAANATELFDADSLFFRLLP